MPTNQNKPPSGISATESKISWFIFNSILMLIGTIGVILCIVYQQPMGLIAGCLLIASGLIGSMILLGYCVWPFGIQSEGYSPV